MSSIFDGIDMSDPCAVWPVLQGVLNRLLAGENVVRARFGEDDQEFQPTNIAALRRQIAILQGQCARKNGRAPARRAITFG